MRRFAILLSACLVCSCGKDYITSPPMGLRAFYSLAVAPKALSLAVGGTQQLTVTPIDTAGMPLSGLPAPRFVSSDTTKVRVSTSGVVTAVALGSARVTASVQASGLTYSDICTVTVASAASRILASFVLSPKTDTVEAGGAVGLQATSKDPGGATINGLGRPFFYSTDTARARVTATGFVIGVSPGKASIIATINSGGIAKVDTAAVVVISPLTATVNLATSFAGGVSLAPGTSAVAPSVITISPAAAVTWVNQTGSAYGTDSTTFAIAFDSPSAVTGGNIPVAEFDANGGYVTRTFAAAGVYTYQVVAHNLVLNTTSQLAGKVIVQQSP